jgi:hypothetical protein
MAQNCALLVFCQDMYAAARPQEAAHLNNKFAQIIELYDEAAGDLARHTKSRRNHG